MTTRFLTTTLALLTLSAAAMAADAPAKFAAGALVDAKGMTLYTFDKDVSGKSNCYDNCAKNWPPAAAMESDKPAGDLTIIKRDDGTMQWADGGKPLYTFVKDTKPGDVTGDNVGSVWHVVKSE